MLGEILKYGRKKNEKSSKEKLNEEYPKGKPKKRKTWRIEISEYPEEKKSKEIRKVVTNEILRVQIYYIYLI
jgi:hypothetical protein